MAAKVLQHEGLDAGPGQAGHDPHHALHVAERGDHLVLVVEVGEVAWQGQGYVEHLDPHHLSLLEALVLSVFDPLAGLSIFVIFISIIIFR